MGYSLIGCLLVLGTLLLFGGSKKKPTEPTVAGMSPTGGDLPGEFMKRPKEPDLPLAAGVKEVFKEKGAFWNHAQFSPKGNYLLLMKRSGLVHKSELRIIHVATGKPLTANSPECNYFSFPAVFSPDETAVACLDGDFVRIWDLTTSPASLLTHKEGWVPDLQGWHKSAGGFANSQEGKDKHGSDSITRVASSEDGKVVATVNGQVMKTAVATTLQRTITITEAASGKELHKIDVPVLGIGGSSTKVRCFSPSYCSVFLTMAIVC